MRTSIFSSTQSTMPSRITRGNDVSQAGRASTTDHISCLRFPTLRNISAQFSNVTSFELNKGLLMAARMRSQNCQGMLSVPTFLVETGKNRLAKIVSDGLSKRTGPPGSSNLMSSRLSELCAATDMVVVERGSWPSTTTTRTLWTKDAFNAWHPRGFKV